MSQEVHVYYLVTRLLESIRKMSLDLRKSLYIDTLQSQSLHDRSLEVNIDAVEEASVSIYKIIYYLGSHSGHNPS